MDTELVFFWGGQERLRLTIRSNDGSQIETNRRGSSLMIPAGAEIRLPDDEEVIGIVTRVIGLGGNRYAIQYYPPVKAKTKRRKKKPPPPPDDEIDSLLEAADAVVADAADVLEVEGEAEAL